ncbi:MAG: thermonuclease family protein [Candidatus Bathyarchaeota archaeon]|nr:MAG: thermonuclease family protein [Candidatus Bathyarchaeota archaeon]
MGTITLGDFHEIRFYENGKKAPLFLLLVLSTCCLVPVAQSECSGEIDMTDVVSYVVDGDTFDVASGDRIRLADVDTPELGEEGYGEAKDFLISLVLSKIVYLDIDDVYGTDIYDRLVCVVYVEHNLSHVANVNKALLEEGVAEVDDYPNEFDPNAWELHCPLEAIPEFPSFLVLPLFMITTLLAATLYRRRQRTQKSLLKRMLERICVG